MEQARLIIDSPAAGDWNMSVDQALLDSADETGAITLRFYSWQQPTLSLGYFQNHADRASHEASRNCPLVRRASGGGAIVHDREITYSLCIPSASRWSKQNARLYRMVHEVLTVALAEQNADCGFYDPEAGVPPEVQIEESAFLCFQRRTDGDLVSAGFKIAGSAQRRLRSSLLQHGSLLLARSDCAPELPGVLELTETDVEVAPLFKTCGSRIGCELGLEFVRAELNPQEICAAREICERQFGNEHWNLKR